MLHARFLKSLSAAITALMVTTVPALAQSCADLAAPIQTKDIGVWWSELDTDKALTVCTKAVEADPDNHSNIAFLARVHSKLGDKDQGRRMLEAISATDNPDALAYLGVLLEDTDMARAVALYERAVPSGNVYAINRLVSILLDEDSPYFDPKRGIAMRQTNAEAGGTLDALNWGRALMYGRFDVPQDQVAAIQFFRLAAEGRAGGAYAELGRAYRWGIGVEQDFETAVAWFEKGVARDNSYSMDQLAYLARFGKGMKKDEELAADLYTRAGEAGRAGAFYSLGYMHSQAFRDREAVSAWRKAADLGDLDALERLGWAYYFGNGVPTDAKEGIRLTVLAAKKGQIYAQQRLGDFVFNGILLSQDYAKARELYEAGAEQKLPYATYQMARIFLEGRGVEKDVDKGIEYLKRAAELGEVKARNLLAISYTRGEGVEKSFDKAADLYQSIIDAGGDGVDLATSNLAELYEQFEGRQPDLEQAEKLYRDAAGQGWKRAMRRLANILIDKGTPEALQEAAELYAKAAARQDSKALDRLEAAFVSADDPLQAMLSAPNEVIQDQFIRIGRNYEEVWISCTLLFTNCGAVSGRQLDLDYAATWYRRAGDAAEAQFRLGAMLMAQAHVEQGDSEAKDALSAAAISGNGEAALLLALQENAGADVADIVEAQLAAVSEKDASRMALFAVAGRFGDAAIGPAWVWLETQAKAGNADARMSLVGAALFLGAFDLAAKELRRIPTEVSIDLSEVDYTLNQALTFLMQAVRQGVTPDPDQLEAIESLLTALAERGAGKADELQMMLDEVRYRLATRDKFEPLDLIDDVAIENRLVAFEERLDDLMSGRGVSPVLVPLYQELAAVQADAGDLRAAEASVYRSVAIARSINEQSRHLTGTLIFHMEMACHERKASDLLFEIGIDNAALALAKSAVNHLQAARANLIGLPQNLQNCFRDLLADQYRRMADLLIRNGYLDEAQAVLAQLKDFETFRYSGEATDRLGATFDPVELSQEQSAVMTRIHGLPLGDLMRLEQEKSALSEEDADALAAVEKKLEAAQLALADSLDSLSDAVSDMDTEASQELAREVSSRQLRRLAGRLDRLDSVAMVYSVSLPERTHFLIVTAEGTEHHELELGEAELNAHIEDIRTALSNPSRDPEPAARAFYDDIWAPVDAALSRLGSGSQVLLVLDGRMRYVPIPALMGPEGWLVKGHRYVTFTPASRDLLLDDEEIETLEVEALGASRGGDGFTPLPYVKTELQTIVGLDGAEGSIVPGRAWLDDRFDEAAFSDALDSGAPIIHVATHFDLTEDEASSRLLLGTGATLSVATLKQGVRAGNYDLNDVQMLVLSACSTGFSGGSELESLATEMQYEGVRTVLATLWPVADQSTAAFMAAFYSELQDGSGRSEALHTVQQRFSEAEDLTMLTTSLRGSFTYAEDDTAPKAVYAGYMHPFYWAGFQMIGQWR